MKLADCLPIELQDKIRSVNGMREIRIRDNRPVKVNVKGQWYYVGEKSFTQNRANAFVLGNDCEDIVKKACNRSVYAYEKMLAKGFFTLEDGVRVGVCGVVAGEKDVVFQRYTSLCFRIPHYVSCVDTNTLVQCGRGNTVVIGQPASGKTTFLRDLAVKLSYGANVMVVDERGELFYDDDVLARSYCDVLKWADKQYAFESGVRAISPDFIVCDELSTDDISYLKRCLNSGVKVICSVHGRSIEDFVARFGILDCFNTAVVLRGPDLPFLVKNLEKTA